MEKENNAGSRIAITILLIICVITVLVIVEFYAVLADTSQTSLDYQNKANKCESEYNDMIYERQQLINKVKKYEKFYGEIK